MNIKLSDLVEVSNNSILTNLVLNMLNSHLDDEDKRTFYEWLRLVRQKQEINNRRKF